MGVAQFDWRYAIMREASWTTRSLFLMVPRAVFLWLRRNMAPRRPLRRGWHGDTNCTPCAKERRCFWTTTSRSLPEGSHTTSLAWFTRKSRLSGGQETRPAAESKHRPRCRANVEGPWVFGLRSSRDRASTAQTTMAARRARALPTAAVA